MADAPRLRGYWSNEDEPLVGTMRRKEWNSVAPPGDQPAPVDLTVTPIAKLLKDASVLGAVATRVNSATVRIAVFRYDAKDAKHVNQDQYDVCTNILLHDNFPLMVVAATTELNDNMRRFAHETVAFTKRPVCDGFEHHLPDVPSDIAALFKRDQ